jgi:hypothetical protein
MFILLHNQIAEKIQYDNPTYSDQELFYRAKCVIHLITFDLIYNEYAVRFHFDDSIKSLFIKNLVIKYFTCKTKKDFKRLKLFDKKKTYKLSIEFVLLYRLHSMIPNEYQGKDKIYTLNELLSIELDNGFDYNNIIQIMYNTSCGKNISSNSPNEMKFAEMVALEQQDIYGLKLNKFKEFYNFKQYSKFEELSTDKEILKHLKKIYKHIDDVGLYEGALIDGEKNKNKFLSKEIKNIFLKYSTINLFNIFSIHFKQCDKLNLLKYYENFTFNNLLETCCDFKVPENLFYAP